MTRRSAFVHKAIIAGRTRVVRKRDAEAFFDGDVASAYAGLALFRLAATNNLLAKPLHSTIPQSFFAIHAA